MQQRTLHRVHIEGPNCPRATLRISSKSMSEILSNIIRTVNVKPDIFCRVYENFTEKGLSRAP